MDQRRWEGGDRIGTVQGESGELGNADGRRVCVQCLDQDGWRVERKARVLRSEGLRGEEGRVWR